MPKAFWDAAQIPGPFDDIDPPEPQEEPLLDDEDLPEKENLGRDVPEPEEAEFDEEWDDDLGDEPPEDDDAD